MHHALKALDLRDVAKNTINAAIAAATYKQAKKQVLQRTEHDRDDLTVRVSATAAGSAASYATRRYTDDFVDKIADWFVARTNEKTEAIVPEVPTKS